MYLSVFVFWWQKINSHQVTKAQNFTKKTINKIQNINYLNLQKQDVSQPLIRIIN